MLSLPNLRGKNVGRMRHDEAWNLATNGATRNPDVGPSVATVQVEDMDLELVRPIIPQLTTTRSSEHSTPTVPSTTGSLDVKGDIGGSSRLGAESPLLMSSAGGSSQRSPTVPEEPWHQSSKSLDAVSSMDAHRQREIKWVSIMSSVPSSQARKSKKVKKLLLEGVPSSVRFLVWAHLADSKARGVPGVYAQLGQRVKASAYHDVRRDVQRCLADQPHLQVPQEALLSLLHTYLTVCLTFGTKEVMTFCFD
jgi:TBC1 domain family member 10